MEYTFTFITDQEYNTARKHKDEFKYDLMRIELYDEFGMMYGEYPVHSMEEFVRNIKYLNEMNIVYLAEKSSSYFDIKEYQEEDDLKDWDVTIGDGLEYL